MVDEILKPSPSHTRQNRSGCANKWSHSNCILAGVPIRSYCIYNTQLTSYKQWCASQRSQYACCRTRL